MKLLFLMYDALPPFRPDVRVLFGDELPKQGVRSDLLGQASSSYSSEALWNGGRYLPQGHQRKGLLGELVRPLQDLWGMVRHLRADHLVLQVRDKIRSGVLAWVVARLTGRIFVYWMAYPFADGFTERAHAVGHSKGLVMWLANRVRAALARRVFYGFLAHHADHLFVQSDAMLEQMHCAHGVPRARMTAVPMGVDAKWLHRDKHALAGDRPAVLAGRRVLAYMGTLARVRQPEFLLRVLEAVRQKEPTAMLLLIGDAPSPDEQAWLRTQIAASPESAWVHLTGWLPVDEAQRWLANADVGLSPVPRGPLLDVGSPTKAVEYLALGLPCVGNDNPDQRLVLMNSGGGVCVPMLVDHFAAGCLGVLADRERAARMGELGRRWVAQNRSYAKLAPMVAEVYKALLRRKN
jgi:glycosyltransferase involved in cell wall biosynthesis